MSLRKIGFYLLSFVLVCFACNNDDDGLGITAPELRDRGEQQIADNDSLVEYLNNHYYNAAVFENNDNPSIKDLVIKKLPVGETEAPNGNVILGDLLNIPNSNLVAKPVVLEETNYVIYILTLNEGGGNISPSFSDNVRVIYEGFNLDNSVFDSAVTPVDFDLVSLIPGWRKVLTEFKVSEFVDDTNGGLNDGIVNYMNHGVGVMFVPSGLAYFSSAPSGIAAYSPIMFKFDLLQAFENDHDEDGIPSYKEDLNGDGEFIVNFDDLTDETDDDTDGDGILNYLDNDDDGDGILTINEDLNNDGDPTNDIGANGIPNYLDIEETASKND